MAAKMGKVRMLEDMFLGLMKKCDNTKDLMRLHCYMEKFSLLQSNFLVSRMLDACVQYVEIQYATSLFRNVLRPNIYVYNAVIRLYTHKENYVLALKTFKQLLSHSEEHLQPDGFTFPFVIRACAGVTDLWLGKQIHGHVCKHGLECNSVIANSLLDMYVKCGAIFEAHGMFDEMREKDVISWNTLITGNMNLGRLRTARALLEAMPNKTIVSWTTMISGYTKAGLFGDALVMFRRLQVLGIQPDWVSLVSVLPACSQLGALELGKWVHSYADKHRLLGITVLCNGLIEMYMKCGGVDQAMQLFSTMRERDVISWSTVICGLAVHGRAHEALDLFDEMQKSKIQPNAITFVGLLSACAHAGLLDQGQKYFHSMQNDYNIEPEIEHYGCLVDILGRTGQIERALEVIKGMKIKPDSAIWGSLLSCCRTHRNLEIAVIAMEQLLELDPGDTANLVSLANIYADLKNWDGVARMRKLMRSKRMKKTPGCSMIEVDSVVEEFVSGGISNPLCRQVLELLSLHWTKTNCDYADTLAQEF